MEKNDDKNDQIIEKGKGGKTKDYIESKGKGKNAENGKKGSKGTGKTGGKDADAALPSTPNNKVGSWAWVPGSSQWFEESQWGWRHSWSWGADSSHGNKWHQWDDWDDLSTYRDTHDEEFDQKDDDEHFHGYPKDPIEISSGDEETATPPTKKARTADGNGAGWGAFHGYDSYDRFHRNWKSC